MTKRTPISNWTDGPFLMRVEDTFQIKRTNRVALVGRVLRGKARRKQEMEIVGGTATIQTFIDEFGGFTHRLDGDNAALVFVDIDFNAIKEHPLVIAAPGSIAMQSKIEVDITMLEPYYGAEKVPPKAPNWSQISIYGHETPAKIVLAEDVGELPPGMKATVQFELKEPLPTDVGAQVLLWESCFVVGVGVVTHLLE
jgi:elongation factor Tu